MQHINLIISLVSLAIAIHLMHDDIVLMLKKTFGFLVVGNGYKKQHYTFSFAEALEWVACYDGACVYKRGNFVAGKAQ